MFEVNTVYRIEQTETKRVVCYGFEYIVPKCINYVAVDEDGTIMGYCFKPENGWDYWSSENDVLFEMGTVRFEGNWRESLIEV